LQRDEKAASLLFFEEKGGKSCNRQQPALRQKALNLSGREKILFYSFSFYFPLLID